MRTRIREFAKTELNEPERHIAEAQGISLYQDQLDYIRSYSYQKKAKGMKVGISEMVREALDPYITALKKKEETP